MTEEMKEGIIILDDKFATEIGFTCDKFEGYLWKKGNYIYISLIQSFNSGHGDLSALFNSILEKGFSIKVPATLPRMESICKRKGFKLTTEHHKEYNEAVDVWVLEQPKSCKNVLGITSHAREKRVERTFY